MYQRPISQTVTVKFQQYETPEFSSRDDYHYLSLNMFKNIIPMQYVMLF